MPLTYAELFAGAGGLSMGLELAGWECAAHAEIEPHARAVLRETWPAVRLDGDVSQVNGADYAGITLLSGGSPCQDLSIAGRRAGMVEGSGTRSSLFFEQVRIWRESDAPYFLWENVLGAFSSNDGRDFAAVLSAIVGAAVAVPANGWESAGVAAGPTGVAAWRVLDCQFFGPPQRRRRVFVLGTRTGGVDPAEVLAVSEGVCGDSAQGRAAGQVVAGDAAGGAGTTGADGTAVGWDDELNPTGHINGTLKALAKSGGAYAGVLAVNISDGAGQLDHVMGTLGARSGGQEVGAQTRGVVMSFQPGNLMRPAGAIPSTETFPTLGATVGVGDQAPHVVTYDARGNGDGNTVNTLAGDHQNRVTDYTAVVLRNREGKPGGGKGPLLSAERSLTLGTGNDQVVFTKQQLGAYTEPASVASTLAARDHASLNTDWVMAGTVGIPRRLMPVECERLMGWPDQHTAYGIAENGTRYALSDTARYRLCGNGVASPVAAWIGFQLRHAIERQRG